MNYFHYSIFTKRAWYKNGGISITPFSSFSFSCSDIFFALFFGAKSVVVVVVVVELSDNFVLAVSIENDAFQMCPFSNHSTLKRSFKCLRFQMETPTQKRRRHSTSILYEIGVMERGPNVVSSPDYVPKDDLAVFER